MQATLSLVVGLVVGVIVLVFAGRATAAQTEPAAKPTVVGWSALGLGSLAMLAGGFMMTGVPGLADPRISIALAAAAMVVSVGALVRHDRKWPAWVGLGMGVVPALFWAFFIAAEIFGPAR